MEKYKPEYLTLEADQTYYWCSCGQSAKKPFCDGAHKQLITPEGEARKKSLVFKVDSTKQYGICTCQLTSTPPYCDGSHKKIS